MITPTTMAFFTKEAKKKKESKSTAAERAAGGVAGVVGGGMAGQVMATPFGLAVKKSIGPAAKGEFPEHMSMEELAKGSPELAEEFKARGGKAYGLNTQAGPHYNPVNRAVYNPKGAHDAISAHELGHATGSAHNIGRGVAMRLGSLATKGSLGYGGYQAIAARGGTDAEKEEAYRKARNAGFVGLAGAAPTLGEEARATYRALKYAPIGRRGEYAKVLAPAYGTYLSVLGAPSAIQAGLAERARRKAAKRLKEKGKK